MEENKKAAQKKKISHAIIMVVLILLFLMFPLYQKTADLPGLESAENTTKNKSFMCIFFTLS